MLSHVWTEEKIRPHVFRDQVGIRIAQEFPDGLALLFPLLYLLALIPAAQAILTMPLFREPALLFVALLLPCGHFPFAVRPRQLPHKRPGHGRRDLSKPLGHKRKELLATSRLLPALV